jgi:hypothetical protein
VARKPGDPKPEPVGGRAAERLREFLTGRLPGKRREPTPEEPVDRDPPGSSPPKGDEPADADPDA